MGNKRQKTGIKTFISSYICLVEYKYRDYVLLMWRESGRGGARGWGGVHLLFSARIDKSLEHLAAG